MRDVIIIGAGGGGPRGGGFGGPAGRIEVSR